MTGRGPDGIRTLFPAPPEIEQERMVEAVLFASAAPMTPAELDARLPHGSDAAAALARLERHYAGRGVRLVRVGAAWAFRTAPDLGFLMHREAVEEKRLSRAAVETLAIVAYHQPVTRAEIEEIRGVATARGTLDLLLELDWIALGPRRQSPGRPATFVTTPAFLDQFGLSSAADLPGLEELKAAGLLGGVGDGPADAALGLDGIAAAADVPAAAGGDAGEDGPEAAGGLSAAREADPTRPPGRAG